HAPAPSPIYPLSLHDALPILNPAPTTAAPRLAPRRCCAPASAAWWPPCPTQTPRFQAAASPCSKRPASRGRSACWKRRRANSTRSEEHTSELQSRENLVCRLL